MSYYSIAEQDETWVAERLGWLAPKADTVAALAKVDERPGGAE